MLKVMIDPGHAPGCANGGKNGYKEYAGMWAVSNYLKAALERCNVQAALTRTENEDPSLEARGGKAKGYDLFISEHSNAGGGVGVECFYSTKRATDKEGANTLAGTVAANMKTTNRGAKIKVGSDYLDYFGVIRSAIAAGCPHVFLIENGFHDNSSDETFLLVDSNLKLIAEAQAAVICGILGTPYAPKETGHWAEESWNYLNQNGINIYEKRYDDNVSRGELFALLERIIKR